MKDFCTVAERDCDQPADRGGYFGPVVNVIPLADIPACYRCGGPVCTSCGEPWLVYWFCPDCLIEQREELQATLERLRRGELFDDAG
jgi:hypothetical protein